MRGHAEQSAQAQDSDYGVSLWLIRFESLRQMFFERGGSCFYRRRFNCLQYLLENRNVAGSRINAGKILKQLQVQACIQWLIVPNPAPLESLKVQDIEVFEIRLAVIDATHG